MKAARYFGISLITLLVVYGVTMTLLSKFRVKSRPVVFMTNDYFTWKGGDTYAKFREWRKEKKYDVVVLGSSRAYRGYSPIVFKDAGYNLFNLGTSAQSIRNTCLVAEHYIDTTNTGLLIVDVFSGAFRSSQLESSSDLVENIDDPDAATDIARNTNDVRAVNLAAVRMLTESDQPYFSKADYAGHGFSIKSDSLPVKLRKQLVHFQQPQTADLVVPPSELGYFDRLLSYCEQKKIKVIVVNSPVSDFYSMANHRIFIAALEPILQKHHVPFYDYSRKLSLSTVDHFYDDTHMNIAGVNIFNRALIDDLKKDGVLR